MGSSNQSWRWKFEGKGRFERDEKYVYAVAEGLPVSTWGSDEGDALRRAARAIGDYLGVLSETQREQSGGKRERGAPRNERYPHAEVKRRAGGWSYVADAPATAGVP